jgi:hypothetical protein
MKNRCRLYRRKLGGPFYVHDSETGKQESLGTRDRAEATTLLNARNESVRQPQLNLHIAKAYLAGTDSGVSTRTWQNALDAIVETKTGSSAVRICTFMMDSFPRWKRAPSSATSSWVKWSRLAAR